MRLVFAGTGEIGAPTLEWLLQAGPSLGFEVVGIVTQPDKPVGRHQKVEASVIKALALRHGLPVMQPLKIREPGAMEQLRAMDPDVLVVMAYGQILPRSVLDLPRMACLNLHASLLPRHRGAAPIQAAILAGDKFSGITVMYMAEGLDTGDILLEKRILLKRRETGGSLHDRLGAIAPEALSEALESLRAGRAPRRPQEEEAEATHTGKLTREHGLICWTSAADVDRRVRAMNPWPGAYTLLPASAGYPERKLKVYSVIQSRSESAGAPSGTVMAVESRGILVAAGTGSVWLTEVQLEGKRRLRASEFLRGTTVSAGIVLGERALP